MTAATPDLARRVIDLRSAFDRAFAAPLQPDRAAGADLIAIRIGGEPFALHLGEVAGLFADRTITRVPGGVAALIGIAGFRGTLVPVYSLRTLLAISATAPPRWLIVAASSPVALAFEAFEGHLRASADAIVPRRTPGQMHSLAPDFICTADVVRPIVNLAAVIAALGAGEAAQPIMQE